MNKEDCFDDWLADHPEVVAEAYQLYRGDLEDALGRIHMSSPDYRLERTKAYAEFGMAVDMFVSDVFDRSWDEEHQQSEEHDAQCASDNIDRQEVMYARSIST